MKRGIAAWQVAKMKQAQEYCDKEDKSMEFMFQYMKDVARVSHEDVMAFLTNNYVVIRGIK